MRSVFNTLDEYLGKLYSLLMYKNSAVILLGTALLVYLAGATPFNRVLREDAFLFVTKGMEIAHGDFSLVREQAIGWPLFLGSIFRLLNIDTIFEAMLAARWISILCICLSVVPITCMAKRLVRKNETDGAVIVVLMAFITAPIIHFAGRHAMSEPLFLLLTLTSMSFLVTDDTNRKKFVYAAIFASLAYYVRANGLFLVAVISGVVLFRKHDTAREKFSDIFIVITVFFLVSAPHLLARYISFGSAFDFGNNSKYFVDSYAAVWADNIRSPSLIEYLTTHEWHEIYKKFVRRGLFWVTQTLFSITGDFWLILTIATGLLYGIIRRWRRFDALFFLLIVSIAGLSIVFDVFHSKRHLIYLIPFVFLIGTGFLANAGFKHFRFSNIILTGVLVFVISSVPKLQWYGTKWIKTPEVQDYWAIYSSTFMEGNVFIVEGGDILQLGQHYSIKSGQQYLQDGKKSHKQFVKVDRNITPIRPGIYNNLEEAIPEFIERNIKYVITDRIHIRRRPYLKEIATKKWQGTFEHLQHFNSGGNGSLLVDIDIYKVNL